MKKMFFNLLILNMFIIVFTGCSTHTTCVNTPKDKQEYKKLLTKTEKLLKEAYSYNYHNRLKVDFNLIYIDESGFFNKEEKVSFETPKLVPNDYKCFRRYPHAKFDPRNCYYSRRSSLPVTVGEDFCKVASIAYNTYSFALRIPKDDGYVQDYMPRVSLRTLNTMKPVNYRGFYRRWRNTCIRGRKRYTCWRASYDIPNTYYRTKASVLKSYLNGIKFKQNGHQKTVRGLKETVKKYDELIDKLVEDTYLEYKKIYHTHEVKGKIYNYQLNGPKNPHFTPNKVVTVPIDTIIKSVTFPEPLIPFIINDNQLEITFDQKTSSLKFYNKTENFIKVKNISFYFKDIIYKVTLPELADGIPPQGEIKASFLIPKGVAIKEITAKKASLLTIKYGLAVQYKINTKTYTLFHVKKYNLLKYLRKVEKSNETK